MIAAVSYRFLDTFSSLELTEHPSCKAASFLDSFLSFGFHSDLLQKPAYIKKQEIARSGKLSLGFVASSRINFVFAFQLMLFFLLGFLYVDNAYGVLRCPFILISAKKKRRNSFFLFNPLPARHFTPSF